MVEMILARFLETLPSLFRKRYLDKHEKFLGSLGEVTAYLYLGWNAASPNHYQLLTQLPLTGKFPITLRDKPASEQPQFRNLRNAWYHELALRYPEDFDTRLKFAGWKIVQGYYCVFSSVAAMVRCIREKGWLSHNQTINIFAHELVGSDKFGCYFLAPAGTFLNQQGRLTNYEAMKTWGYARLYHIPQIRKCLRSARERKHELTTAVHYLKSLREWATYEDAYLLFRMYGQTVKKGLDFSLQTLATLYLVHVEYFLTRAFEVIDQRSMGSWKQRKALDRSQSFAMDRSSQNLC